MATYAPHSHSPRVFPQNPAPLTPVHSPHHSITSSISTRTPLHTLSIHEYRKQQNTPGSQTATPPGKTLRRKAAAPSLNGLERVPSLTRATHSGSRSSFRPLHSSQSAQQLHSHPSPFQSQLLSDHIARSQSAEPRNQGGSISSISTVTSTGRIRYFNSRKRLPKPDATESSFPFPPQPTLPRHTHLSDTRTTYTTSSFSLSRFPNPPHQEDFSLFTSQHGSEVPHMITPNFTSAAPATPPATPATIHYRGASFDLVNPHDSLPLHDIVTPSREIGSSEYLSVQPFDEPLVNSAEMAPKRALYGDLNAAHAGIMRRVDDPSSGSNIDLPPSPEPAVVSPNSSTYSLAPYSPDSDLAPSPLEVKKANNSSAFSLKQLTRTLTKKLGKSPEKQNEQELQELRNPILRLATISNTGDFPRPLSQTYTPTRQSAYFPLGPASPLTPTSPGSPPEQASGITNDKYKQRGGRSMQRYDTEPLTSLIPDDLSTQMGRGEDPRTSMSEAHISSRPYYDDLDSIYPSSSAYAGDERPGSNYQQSLTSARQSKDFLLYSDRSASTYANEYKPDSLYRYSIQNNRKSKNQSQELDAYSAAREKTDTISKIIDQYDPVTSTNNTISMNSQEIDDSRVLPSSHLNSVEQSEFEDHPQQARTISDQSQFEFDIQQEANYVNQNDSGYRASQSGFTRRPGMARDLGSPPRAPAPLAPPFQFNKDSPSIMPPESSGLLSNSSSSSYGDTKNLLQISQTDTASFTAPNRALQPSSSYSQPEARLPEPSSSYSQPSLKPLDTSASYSQASLPSPNTPQEALDQAEQIFEGAIREQREKEKGIPAMWARRNSGSMLLAKNTEDQDSKSLASEPFSIDQDMIGEANEADWESDAGEDVEVRKTPGSVADYSSSEGSRDSLGLSTELPLVSREHPQRPSMYRHPSPIRAHQHPFSSSSPPLQPLPRTNTAPTSSSPRSPLSPSPLGSTTVPAFPVPANYPKDALSRNDAQQPYPATPRVDQYALSDKETEELLASGPNDKIIFDYKRDSVGTYGIGATHGNTNAPMPVSGSPLNVSDRAVMERENTFEKLCSIGPKRNLTGNPMGTGMRGTGNDIADNSSPGLPLSAIVAHRNSREKSGSANYRGFYAAPFEAVGSVTRIEQGRPPREPEYERTPSQMTLFPRSSELQPVVETSPTAGAFHRQSLRSSTTFQRAQRRSSRTAVPGQTKLRQMILTPEAGRKTLSSADTNFSRLFGGSDRPSTCHTESPLRPLGNIDTAPTVQTVIARHDSPRLLCPERVPSPEDEERRRKLSWTILAWFCLLPPCMMLFPFWGDSIITTITKGHLGYCTPKSKRVALVAAVVVNLGITTAIVVPILVLHALAAA